MIKNRKGDILELNDLRKMFIHKHGSNRFIEIDLIRGLAITLMVFGHILWDLDYFKLVSMNNMIYSSLQKIVPPLFFIIVGVGLIVSKKKAELKTKEEENKYYTGLIIRGLKIFNLGMILTVISMIFFPDRVIMFGVLHCIGITIILSVPFLKYRNYNFLFGMIILFAWTIFGQLHIENPTYFHLVLGLHQANFWRFTIDYFPLIPWFGVTLLGITIGDWLYCGDRRMFRMPDLSKYKPAKIFSWIGQHSLSIYLLHQPVIAGVLYLFIKFY